MVIPEDPVLDQYVLKPIVERMFEDLGRRARIQVLEEVEVWMLALHRERLGVPWQQVRADRDPKERFATPLLAQLAPRMALGGGRVRAMEPLGHKQWRSLLQLCPELEELRKRLSAWLSDR